MIVFLIVALILAVFAIIFALQNAASVTLTFLLWSFQGSLALVVIVTLLAGVLITLLALAPALVRGRLRVRSHRKRVTELEGTLEEHKRQLEELRQGQQDTSKSEKEQDTPSESS